MSCRNHPQTLAVATCTGCAEPFCQNCLVQLSGQFYCGSCKVLALNGREPILENRLRPCKEAADALKFAFIGLLCFGFVLGPMAIFKAIEAKKIMREDPTLLGSGKSTAALVVGVFALGLWLVNLVSRFS